MKIYCVCIVRNEDDVLEEAVEAAVRWADAIFIADHQSTDRTPLLIESLAARYSNVYDVGKLTGPFSDDMRAIVFNRARHVSAPGDWWCRLDADEFYLDDPREFLANAPEDVDTVWSSHFQFYFTDRDLQQYRAAPKAFLAIPVRERLRYYRNNSTEIRFVKHTRPFIWDAQWPRFRCAAWTRRIKVAHYQYRSPDQITKRLEARRLVLQETGGRVFVHESPCVTSAGANGETTTNLMNPTTVEPPAFIERVFDASDFDDCEGGRFVDREDELATVTGIRPEAVPVWLWKPYCIAKSAARYAARRFQTHFS